MSFADRDGVIWMDGELVPWRDAKVHVLTHTLHYGMGVFEGVRAYNTPKGAAIFRLTEHTNRLFRSAHIMAMNMPWSKEELIAAQKLVVRENGLQEGYLRPMAFLGSEGMGLRADNLRTHVMVAAWEWPSYMSPEAAEQGIKVRTSSYTRHHVNISMCKAKANGHYINSMLALKEALDSGCEEALLLDNEGYVAEGSGENIFLVRDGVLYTPELTSCLDGITRNTVVQLAADCGYTVKEKRITRDEVYIADEAFFTGTAAEVLPICSLDGRTIGPGKRGPITEQLQSLYFDLVRGQGEGHSEWLELVTEEDTALAPAPCRRLPRLVSLTHDAMTHDDLSDSSELADETTERLLVIGPAWVGDMVMAESLFGLLKAQRPEREIDVMAPAWTNPLLARMPSVDGRLEMPLGHGQFSLKRRYQLGKALRGRYQQAIVLPNSWKSALLPLFAQIPERTGWRGEMRFGLLNDIRLLDKRRYPLMVERFVALGLKPGAALPSPLPAPRLVAFAERLPALYEKFAIPQQRPVLALCPGAEFGPAKQWPPRHYAQVAARKIQQGWQVWIMGSAKDQPAAQAIVDNLGKDQAQHVTVLAGQTGLDEAIDLMSSADAVISNDSGLMHIAAALDRPLVAVYGSTSPGFTPPLGQRVTTQSIAVDCGPCFQRECPQGHLKCLVDLSPDQIIAGLDTVVGEQPVRMPTGPAEP